MISKFFLFFLFFVSIAFSNTSPDRSEYPQAENLPNNNNNSSDEKSDDEFAKEFTYRLTDTVKVQIVDKTSDIVEIRELKINQTFAFKRIRIIARKCFVSPIDKPLNYICYVEVFHIPYSEGVTKIFSNWMFTENISTNILEHPVYDIKILK